MDEKKMIDPMAFDTEEGLEKKKETWNDIFQRCPDFTDLIIKLFEEHDGEETINSLTSSIKESLAKYNHELATTILNTIDVPED